MIRIIILSMLTMPIFAQQSISVEQARELGLANNASIKNAKLDFQYAKNQVRESISLGLPSVRGEFNWQQFLEIPTSLIPANAFDPSALEDEVLELQFGTEYAANASLTASQLIFDGTYLVGLRASSIFKKLSHQSLLLTTQQIQDSISAAYFNVLVAEDRKEFLALIVDIHKDILSEVEAKFEQGMVEDTDVDRMALTLANMKTQSENMNRMTEVAHLFLKLSIGMPLDQELILTDSLEGLLAAQSQVLFQEPEVENTLEYKLAESNVRLNNMDVRRFQSMYLPSVEAFGSYSSNAMRNEFNFTNDGKWYPTKLIGIKASMNIFSGFNNRIQVQKAKVRLAQAKNDLETANQYLYLKHLTAKSSYLSSINNQKYKTSSLELSKKIYLKTMLKYNEGLVSSMELSQAGVDYTEAYQENSRSIYDLLIDKINYERTLGK
jgi:outer membrane protein TolC